MLKYIIRLDDACTRMNKKNWDRIEKLLDKYNIKPIVGIIPDSKDEAFLKFPYIEEFWKNYAINWQKKGWIIAQHGLNHNLNADVRTEFKGKGYEEQKEIIEKGYLILKNNGIIPKCFFAPAHTFDNNTVKICDELKYFEFISDGYAFYPYQYKNVMFLPSVFDTPHIISKNGVFTFVYHPNNMKDTQFEYLEKFIVQNKENFEVNIDSIIKQFEYRKRNIKDILLEISIYIYRILRKILKGDLNEQK